VIKARLCLISVHLCNAMSVTSFIIRYTFDAGVGSCFAYLTHDVRQSGVGHGGILCNSATAPSSPIRFQKAEAFTANKQLACSGHPMLCNMSVSAAVAIPKAITHSQIRSILLMPWRAIHIVLFRTRRAWIFCSLLDITLQKWLAGMTSSTFDTLAGRWMYYISLSAR
jgi:hypothetical protein